jgi:hypothetical protein
MRAKENARPLAGRLKLTAVAGLVVLLTAITAGPAWAPRECGTCGGLEKVAHRLSKVNELLNEIQAAWQAPADEAKPAVRALLQRIMNEADAIDQSVQELLATTER